MLNIEKIKNNRKPIIAGIFIASILIDGSFFPIANFNPHSPVNLGILMRLMILAMAFSFHKAIGSLEAVILLGRSAAFIGVFNIAMVLCGLLCRYLLEFGEVSNTYNFTIANVLFQVAALALISTAVCILEQKKK